MTSHQLSAPISISLLLLLPILFSPFLRFADGGQKKIHITDNLDDVVDDEEDDAWKEWGKPPPPKDFGPAPEDLANMELPQIQAEVMKNHVGPTIGFVKLRLGVKRTKESVTELSNKWVKLLRTGKVEVMFMGIDLSTIMFTTQRGRDNSELIEFILEQEDAYEVKVGERSFRRPGDPPIEDVIESLQREREKKEKEREKKEDVHSKAEL